VSQEQLNRVTGYLNIGRQEGARPLSGGERLTDGAMAKGFFVPPTVFADVRDDMRIAQEEIFGPVISAIPFTDIDEVIGRANQTQFGLDSGRWQGAPIGEGDPSGVGVDQLLPGDGSSGAVRRVQDEWLWPGIRRAASGRVFEREGGLD
jgi:hypothetical protein